MDGLYRDSSDQRLVSRHGRTCFIVGRRYWRTFLTVKCREAHTLQHLPLLIIHQFWEVQPITVHVFVSQEDFTKLKGREGLRLTDFPIKCFPEGCA